MSDDTPKKPEQVEGKKPPEKSKIAETATDKDREQKIREIRRGLKDGEMAFSFAGMATASKAKFELVDGESQVAAATPNRRLRAEGRPAEARTPDGTATDSAAPATRPGAPTRPVDLNQAMRDAEAIRKATGNDNWVARWADKDAINKILEGKTEAERKAINDAYVKKYGRSLEEEMRAFEKGADLDKFLNILHRTDNNAENTAARRIHEDLLENHNLIQGRSSSQIEKDIRDLVSTRNSDQVAKLDQEYRQTYGMSLSDAIAKDDKISQNTKDMLSIYMRGNDKRTDQDSARLIDLSLKAKDGDLFAESMRDASPTARKAFLDNNGEQRITDAFGHWYSNSAVRNAMDYARDGKLSAATQIRDNTGIMFDNEQGVQLAINRMTDRERKMYADGKSLSEGRAISGLNADQQKEAKDYYSAVHEALSKTANATEMIKYEDMIATKGGSIVSALAHHRGTVYNSGMDAITDDVRNMTQAQYDDAKAYPERRAELAQMLRSLNKSDAEAGQVLSVYDKMVSAADYGKAQEAGKKEISSEIAGSQHWYGTDSERLMNSITNMSASDQNRYRTDEQFRNQIDGAVKNSLTNPERLDAAQRMLNQVREGRAPDTDVVALLKMTPNYDGGKTEEIARRLDNALSAHPDVRERLLHPQTDEDKRYAAEFKAAAERAFGEDYENFGKPIVETGRLPLERKASLTQGVFTNAYKQAFEDLQHASPEEKQRLKDDPAYREKVLGYMDANRQQIAMATIDQTELKPEDNVRAAVVGWGGSSDIVAELQNIRPEDLDRVKRDYAQKYGSSLAGDLLSKLGGEDKDIAERILAQNLSTDVRANIARTQTENARTGIGAALNDHVFRSGTGEQADDAQNQTNAAISEQNRLVAAINSGSELARNMSPEQIQQLQQRLAATVNEAIRNQNQATDNAVESKKAAANYVADGAIITAAIGSMIVTGGASTPLVIGLAAAGATIKVGTNMAIQGNNYDLSLGQVGWDAGIGSITAATSVIGPGEIAAVFGIGKVAATKAAGLALAETSEQILAQGARETLERGTRELVQNTLASGATKLNPSDFVALANRAVSTELPEAARKIAVEQLAANLQRNVTEQLATGVTRQATAVALNAGGGAAGGGLSGGAQGFGEWDSRKSVAENVATIFARTGEGALGGSIIGGGIAAGTTTGGRILESLRNSSTGENTLARAARGGERPVPPNAERPTVAETPTTAERPANGERPANAERPTNAEPPTTPERPAVAERPATENPNLERAAAVPERPQPREGFPRNYNDKGQLLDSKGNILEHDWPKVRPENVERVRAQVRTELAQVKGSDGMSVVEKLDRANLSAEQKNRILDSLGEVREHYARTFATDVDQPVNWIHTQGELGRVIDAAQSMKLTPEQTEDALLASMFSDSLKTKANFTTHHIDGELSAERILGDRLGGNFTQERLDGILHAIREHQIAPPAFMAMIYGGAIRRSIGRDLTPEETTTLNSLLKKMSNPFTSPHVDAPGGGKILELSDAERAMLNRTGADNWHVPSEGTPWYKMSRALIDGDGIDNYATPGGLSKIIQIRGPETGPFFKDGNLRFENPERAAGQPPSSSQESWRDSFNDFANVASPEGLKVARTAAAEAETAAVAAQSRVDAWLRGKLGLGPNEELPTIPGWTGKPKLDAAGKPVMRNGRPVMEPDNVKYPQYEQRWWDIHMKPAAARSAEEKAYYEDVANRYRGLNEQRIREFRLLQEIRDRYAVELRKEQRVAGDAAPDYQPVVR